MQLEFDPEEEPLTGSSQSQERKSFDAEEGEFQAAISDCIYEFHNFWDIAEAITMGVKFQDYLRKPNPFEFFLASMYSVKHYYLEPYTLKALIEVELFQKNTSTEMVLKVMESANYVLSVIDEAKTSAEFDITLYEHAARIMHFATGACRSLAIRLELRKYVLVQLEKLEQD